MFAFSSTCAKYLQKICIINFLRQCSNMPKVRPVIRMGFIANFICFPAVHFENFENRSTFDKVTESVKVGTFLRHSVVQAIYSLWGIFAGIPEIESIKLVWVNSIQINTVHACAWLHTVLSMVIELFVSLTREAVVRMNIIVLLLSGQFVQP